MPNCVSRVCEAFDSCEVLPLSPPAVMVAWGVVSTHARNEKKRWTATMSYTKARCDV